MGLGYVRGLREAWQARIVERRGEKPYRDLADLCRRTRLPRPLVENLIRAGALDGFDGQDRSARRNLLWALGGLVYHEEGLDLEIPVVAADLPILGDAQRLAWEYELLGLAPGTQVMALYRDVLQRYGVLTSGEVARRRQGERVRVAGWAVVRQRPPTAGGMLFLTLEDEEGLVNLVVRPDVYERYREALRSAPLLWVEGQVQREGEAISILVHQAASLVPRRQRT